MVRYPPLETLSTGGFAFRTEIAALFSYQAARLVVVTLAAPWQAFLVLVFLKQGKSRPWWGLRAQSATRAAHVAVAQPRGAASPSAHCLWGASVCRAGLLPRSCIPIVPKRTADRAVTVQQARELPSKPCQPDGKYFLEARRSLCPAGARFGWACPGPNSRRWWELGVCSAPAHVGCPQTCVCVSRGWLGHLPSALPRSLSATSGVLPPALTVLQIFQPRSVPWAGFEFPVFQKAQFDCFAGRGWQKEQVSHNAEMFFLLLLPSSGTSRPWNEN